MVGMPAMVRFRYFEPFLLICQCGGGGCESGLGGGCCGADSPLAALLLPPPGAEVVECAEGDRE